MFLIFLTQMGLINAEALINKRKIAIVTIFAVAAVITPPDVMSQILLALPMLVLYEITILICKKIKRDQNHA